MKNGTWLSLVACGPCLVSAGDSPWRVTGGPWLAMFPARCAHSACAEESSGPCKIVQEKQEVTTVGLFLIWLGKRSSGLASRLALSGLAPRS
ncbi:hypothetical protein BT67DRAFT_160606 [Trichocladium antarcticum]|uniref:Secreted protein n=1 Tax=Trichocladium antarcticum TaxID=1450529 RepID=A0AAN6ZAN9_9PEZI|nr:hypothetical protein BT67DRAFT_160606 [Trichocladium antarcticum]